MCSVILAVRRCLLARIIMQQLSVALFLTALLAASLATPAHAADDPTAGVKSLVERTLANCPQQGNVAERQTRRIQGHA
jgi:hypothetical protein